MRISIYYKLTIIIQSKNYWKDSIKSYPHFVNKIKEILIKLNKKMGNCLANNETKLQKEILNKIKKNI